MTPYNLIMKFAESKKIIANPKGQFSTMPAEDKALAEKVLRAYQWSCGESYFFDVSDLTLPVLSSMITTDRIENVVMPFDDVYFETKEIDKDDNNVTNGIVMSQGINDENVPIWTFAVAQAAKDPRITPSRIMFFEVAIFDNQPWVSAHMTVVFQQGQFIVAEDGMSMFDSVPLAKVD